MITKHDYNSWQEFMDKNFAEFERVVKEKVGEAVEELRREGRLPSNDCGDREGIGEEV